MKTILLSIIFVTSAFVKTHAGKSGVLLFALRRGLDAFFDVDAGED